MDAIVNPDNIKPGIDLKELERQMINGGLIIPSVREPTDKFADELRFAAEELGISFDLLPAATPAATPAPAPTPARPSMTPARPFVPTTPATVTTPQTAVTQYQPRVEPVVSSRYDDSDDDEPPISRGGDLHSRTQEQERRAHIDSVMGGQAEGLSFEVEKREDMKCVMLAEIDSLISTMREEGIDISRLPEVTKDSEYGAVSDVLNILRHKNDHTRYCTFAEEFLIFGAHGLEELFDGKRLWLGRYSPDLRGWHHHVNVKLRRMRHDTGQIVSGVMQEYNIGPGMRVLLELVPNMVLYSKTRKRHHDQPGGFSDDEMANSIQAIRDLEPAKRTQN